MSEVGRQVFRTPRGVMIPSRELCSGHLKDEAMRVTAGAIAVLGLAVTAAGAQPPARERAAEFQAPRAATADELPPTVARGAGNDFPSAPYLSTSPVPKGLGSSWSSGNAATWSPGGAGAVPTGGNVASSGAGLATGFPTATGTAVPALPGTNTPTDPSAQPGLLSRLKGFVGVDKPPTPKAVVQQVAQPEQPTASTPFRSTGVNGSPVYAGPPAYRWYGWGTVTPGANPLAPNGQYPKASANWYAITGATPGAFPVSAGSPVRTPPGTDPPTYVQARGPGVAQGVIPVAGEPPPPPAYQQPQQVSAPYDPPEMRPGPTGSKFVPAPTPAFNPPAPAPAPAFIPPTLPGPTPTPAFLPPSAPASAPVNVPTMAAPPSPKAAPAPPAFIPPPDFPNPATARPPSPQPPTDAEPAPVSVTAPPVPQLVPAPVVAPTKPIAPVTNTEPPTSAPPGPVASFEGAPSPLPISVTDKPLPAPDKPAPAPERRAEEPQWRPHTEPATHAPGTWAPAPAADPASQSWRSGTSAAAPVVARGQMSDPAPDPITALIKLVCKDRAEGVEVRWTGAKKLSVCFEIRTPAAAKKLVEDLCKRPELKAYQIDFCVLVK